MPRYLEFETPKGEILIAVHSAQDGISAVKSPTEIIEKAEASLDEVFRRISGITHALAQAIAASKEGISSAEIEFGVQLKGRTKLCVVEGEATAAFKVKLVFKPV